MPLFRIVSGAISSELVLPFLPLAYRRCRTTCWLKTDLIFVRDELDGFQYRAVWYTTLNRDGLSLGAVHTEDPCPVRRV